ncbi:hypothetical protein D6825_03110 [Candidatus Woesearchaeota archaeon]|nr:MAG: hypothetical protein D6825_03110 [Candidatus Woesearchaeota archaeon]
MDVEQLNRFTKNIDFGSIKQVPRAELSGEQAIIAKVRDVPIITIKQQGKGKTVYYGIPSLSDFKYTPDYPIFWTELLKYVTDQQDVRNLNFKTGQTLILDSEQKIKTPAGTVKKSALVLDFAGVYELEDRTIAVNIVDELESDVNLKEPKGTKSTDYKLRPVKETRKFQWDLLLIATALLLVIFEEFFVRYRGDL